jgi:hypothetical protein
MTLTVSDFSYLCYTITQIIWKSLTKRQIQCVNNISCHGFEFAMSYRALQGLVKDPLS